MAVKKINVTKTEGWKWKFHGSAAEDKATSEGEYTDDFKGWASRAPLYQSADPYLPDLKLVTIDAERTEGEQVRVSLKYESFSSAAQYPGRAPNGGKIKRYSAEITNGEEHILTHSRYGENLDEDELKALLSISNGTEDKGDGSAYADDITTELGLEVLAKIRKGTVARKSSGLIWIEKSTTESLADINYPGIDKTEKPPGGVGGAANNWLYRGSPATESAQGGVFELEKRWEYSPDGWDQDLYGEAE